MPLAAEELAVRSSENGTIDRRGSEVFVRQRLARRTV
jgi:hypothetical protein